MQLAIISLVMFIAGIIGCVVFGWLSDQGGEAGLAWIVPVLLSMALAATGATGLIAATIWKIWT
jgi:hypothetical protein